MICLLSLATLLIPRKKRTEIEEMTLFLALIVKMKPRISSKALISTS